MKRTIQSLFAWIIALATIVMPAYALAENTIETEQLSYDNTGQRLLFRSTCISNSGACTTVGFNIECQDLPFTIDSVQIVVCDTVYYPDHRFSLTGSDKEVLHRRQLWRVKAEFPQLFAFADDDELRLFTSEGQFNIPLHPSAIAASEVSSLQMELTELQSAYYWQRIIMWGLIAFTLVCLLAAVLYVVLKNHRYTNLIRAEKEQVEADRLKIVGELSTIADEKKDLMHKGFDIFNTLCNEYFEKSDSELARTTLVKDLEDVILSYRSEKNLEDLRQLVNLNMNGILSKIKEEMPSISEMDIQFLTYLYAGFSPRAVCLMTDSKLKNFYNRRTRLKEKILAGDSPHREWFASEM